MNQTADVVIVGGGLMGCSVAFHLARRGVDVAVLEKDNIGMGATGRSSAIIRQHYSNELTARMALHSLAVFESFDERVGGECGFTRTGFLVIVEDEDRAGMEANVALQRGVGIETHLLSPEDLQELMPGIETGDLVCAAYEPKSGYADPHMTTHGYAAAARRLGATFHVGQEVTGVRFEGDRVVGVDTESQGFAAPVIVNCAGPWGAAVGRMTGVEMPIVSSRVQVATFRRPATFEGSHPVVIDFVHGSYFRSETGELSLVGSVDPSEADDVVDPDSYPEHVDPEFVAEVGGSFVRRYPPMERALSTGGYAGLYAITPDWHPIVDEVPKGSGSFVCSGFSGHGFKLAPAVGAMTADLVTGATDPEFPPHLFRFARYAEGDLVRGQYQYSITG